MLLAFIVLRQLPPPAPDENQAQYENAHSTDAIVEAMISGSWSRVEAYKREVKSFKNPIYLWDPGRRRGGDILTQLAYYGDVSDRYGNALTGMRIAIQYGADPNEGGGVPLLAAVQDDAYGKMVERLLRYGARPDGSSGMLRTPLGQAISWARFQNLEILLNADADPNRATFSRWPRWPGPGSGVKSPTPSTLRGYPTERELSFPLALVARFGWTKAVPLLLRAGARVNARDPKTGLTALHEAAENDHPEVIALLLKAGAIKTARDKRGRTPLRDARIFGAKRAIRALGG